MSIKRFVKTWVPVIAWMLLIFAGSTDVLSAEHTSRFIVPFLLWIDPHMSYPTLVRMNILMRKLGHVTEYAILAALLWRALPTVVKTRLGLAGLTLLLASIYAALDEFHQSFVATRTPSERDVFMIDIGGATIALTICLLISRRRKPAFASARETREDRASKISGA